MQQSFPLGAVPPPRLLLGQRIEILMAPIGISPLGGVIRGRLSAGSNWEAAMMTCRAQTIAPVGSG